MVQLAAVEAQSPCRFFRVNLKLHASSRFKTISMVYMKTNTFLQK